MTSCDLANGDFPFWVPLKSTEGQRERRERERETERDPCCGVPPLTPTPRTCSSAPAVRASPPSTGRQNSESVATSCAASKTSWGPAMFEEHPLAGIQGEPGIRGGSVSVCVSVLPWMYVCVRVSVRAWLSEETSRRPTICLLERRDPGIDYLRQTLMVAFHRICC